MKLDKKGYTLVELIMIITIISLVLIIVFPSILSMQKKNKTKEYEHYTDTMITSAKLYFDSKGEDITSKYWHGCVALSYQDLVNSGLLKQFNKDGVTCSNSKVYVTKNGDKVEYKPYIKCMQGSKVVYENTNPYANASSCRLTVEDAPDVTIRNEHIIKVYQYNQTSCVTGEESTCQEINPLPSTYDVGTIVKYKVNDSTEKYFYVIADNGDTLTLQQRENTINKTAWYTVYQDNSFGPLQVLPALEEATASWSNVLDQEYTLGTTVFKTNAYTGCSTYNSCRINRYTLSRRIAKARMISVQEVAALGCTTSSKTCPIWMYNYLFDSTNQGGTQNGTDMGYWTLTAKTSDLVNVWTVDYYGRISYYNLDKADNGARAVIMIKK